MTKPIKKEIIETLPFGLIITSNVGIFYKEKQKLFYTETIPLPSFKKKRDNEIWNECQKEIKEEEKNLPPPSITSYNERDSDFE